MMSIRNVRSKVCLVGDAGVGKTSLIHRYVYDAFNDKYIITVGTKVSRKEMMFKYPARDVQVKLDAMIWDIMGQRAFKSLLHDAYFLGAQGILGVCNLTDENTLPSLIEWIMSVNKVVGRVPVVLLANKFDLEDEIVLTKGELRLIARQLNAQVIYTSAKTGQNVAEAFFTLGREMLRNQFNLC